MGVSLDAPDERTSAKTKGQGAFRPAREAVRTLLKRGAPVCVLVTLTRHNFDSLEEHVRWLEGLGVTFVTLPDLRPLGTPAQCDLTRLTVGQEVRLRATLARIRKDHPALVVEPSELLICDKARSSGMVMQKGSRLPWCQGRPPE